MDTIDPISQQAAAMTKAASKQTYYTIRFLADRDRIADAYCAYAYFRWADDVLDAETISGIERCAFLRRQYMLLDQAYRGESARDICPEEEMLIRLVRNDTEPNSGLQFYLRNMMAVLSFDVRRRGRLISQTELDRYTGWLAGAVTEALHYFIGHDDFSPHNEARSLAVTAAHITHMLRDTFEDARAGYFNLPCEIFGANRVHPLDVRGNEYRAWVYSRVKLARAYFKQGKCYLRQVENPRCRLAGFAYIARFEWLLDTIAREGYCLRSEYTERKSLGTGVRMGWLAFGSILTPQENLSRVLR